VIKKLDEIYRNFSGFGMEGVFSKTLLEPGEMIFIECDKILDKLAADI